MSEKGAGSRFPWQLILMLIIVVSTILAGFLVFPTTQEQRDKLLAELGTTNHGTLLLPVKTLNDLVLTDQNGNAWDWSQQKRKWRLLIPSPTACSQACEDALFTTRQVHVRLAKYATRVERMFVDLGGESDRDISAYLDAEHPHIINVTAQANQFEEWLAGTNLPRDGVLVPAILIDPAGVAMMFYTPEQSGNDMLEDLNHLLKYSKE